MSFITTQSQLTDICNKAKQKDSIALDTEFIWEKSYYPRLGLIQIGFSNEECYLIDPTVLSNWLPLKELLEDNRTIKILHDCSQDLAILSRVSGAIPTNIFDTQLAASFAGLPASLSLEKLTFELLQIQLNKSATRTNWLKRPLHDGQIRYAKDDVRYLRALRIVLLERIIAPQVKWWLQEELQRFNNPENYNLFNPCEPYRKVKGYHMLRSKSLSILEPLARWREQTAQLEDRPRGRILSNQIMLNIAKQRPRNRKQLYAVKMTHKDVDSYGDTIVKITCSAQDSSILNSNKKITPFSSKEMALFESLRKYIILKGDLLGIAPACIGSMKELRRMVRRITLEKEYDDLRQGCGWRREFFADFFITVTDVTQPEFAVAHRKLSEQL